jgi:chromosome segregation ATPase
MSQSARVLSIEDIEALHAGLARFGAQGQEALARAALEIRRTVESVQDKLQTWQREVLKRQEEVARARADLAHRRSMLDGGRSGAVDQEIALARAKQRLRDAEDKVAMCRRWLMQLPEVIKEYEGYARTLAGMLDANLKQSLVLLQNKIGVLKTYTGLGAPPAAEAAPAAPAAPPPPASGEST